MPRHGGFGQRSASAVFPIVRGSRQSASRLHLPVMPSDSPDASCLSRRIAQDLANGNLVVVPSPQEVTTAQQAYANLPAAKRNGVCTVTQINRNGWLLHGAPDQEATGTGMVSQQRNLVKAVFGA